MQVSEFLWRGTSGTLINHLLWHQTLSSLNDFRITDLGCGLTYGALKVSHQVIVDSLAFYNISLSLTFLLFWFIILLSNFLFYRWVILVYKQPDSPLHVSLW